MALEGFSSFSSLMISFRVNLQIIAPKGTGCKYHYFYLLPLLLKHNPIQEPAPVQIRQ